MSKTTNGVGKHVGSCHCGAVKFEAHVDESVTAPPTSGAFDDLDPADVKIGYWDGRHDNWQAGMRDRPWPIAP
jgi:hypothetical protein